MARVSELYTLYLKPKHLPQNGTKEATISAATVETLHPRPGLETRLIVLSFVDKPHKLIVNQGNANRLRDICGDDIGAWPGLVIGLKVGKWGKRDTIIIEPANGAIGQ